MKLFNFKRILRRFLRCFLTGNRLAFGIAQELVSALILGDFCKLRKEKPFGFDCRNLEETAKKILKSLERILIIKFSKEI